MRRYIVPAVVFVGLMCNTAAHSQGTFLEEGELGFSGIAARSFAAETDASMVGVSAASNGRFEAGLLFGGVDHTDVTFAAPFVSFIRQTPTDKGRSLFVGTLAYQMFDELGLMNIQFSVGYDYKASQSLAIQPYVAPSIGFALSGALADGYKTDIVVAGGITLYQKNKDIIPAVDASIGYDTQAKEMVVTLGASLTFFGRGK